MNIMRYKLINGSESIDLLMTLKSRLATAAAAIVQRIITRRNPRVVRPLSPFRKGDIELVASVDDMAKVFHWERKQFDRTKLSSVLYF